MASTVTTRWKAKLAVRKGLLATAERRARYWREKKAHANRPSKAFSHAAALLADREALVAKRRAQVAEAEAVIARHTSVPLREKAWGEMQKLIDAKVTEVGGNNRGQMVEQIIRANGGVPGEAWCGDTVAYCYLRAGSKSVVRSWASVSWLERFLTTVRSHSNVKRGHVVTYSFSHTGLFDRWAPEKGAGYFYCGEGNTGNSGAVSDSVTGGDGVKLKLRHISLVSGFHTVRN